MKEIIKNILLWFSVVVMGLFILLYIYLKLKVHLVDFPKTHPGRKSEEFYTFIKKWGKDNNISFGLDFGMYVYYKSILTRGIMVYPPEKTIWCMSEYEDKCNDLKIQILKNGFGEYMIKNVKS